MLYEVTTRLSQSNWSWLQAKQFPISPHHQHHTPLRRVSEYILNILIVMLLIKGIIIVMNYDFLLWSLGKGQARIDKGWWKVKDLKA